MKKFLIILQLTLAIAFWLRLELSQLSYLILIPYFVSAMFATLFLVARRGPRPVGQQVLTGGVAGFLFSLGFNPGIPDMFVTAFFSLGWLFGMLLFAAFFIDTDAPGRKASVPFKRFAARYPADEGNVRDAGGDSPLSMLRARFGGKSFGAGMYRIYSQGEAATATQALEQAHPDAAGKIDVFAYDWLNRVFALDTSRLRNGEPMVVMFSPLTGEFLDAPVGLVAFHDRSLVDSPDDILDANLFKTFLRTNSLTGLGRAQSVTLRMPLSQGGQLEAGNLTLV
jgi:hypothetical protein